MNVDEHFYLLYWGNGRSVFTEYSDLNNKKESFFCSGMKNPVFDVKFITLLELVVNDLLRRSRMQFILQYNIFWL